MGLRINLQHANWLAHILNADGPIPKPPVERDWETGALLHEFINQISRSFYSDSGNKAIWHDKIQEASNALHAGGPAGFKAFLPAIEQIRGFLADRPWTALILPSTASTTFDRILCNEELLDELVRIRPDDPGLILQLQEPPRDTLALHGLFPALKTALASISNWPGVLIWQNQSTSQYFSLAEGPIYKNQLQWLFTHLATAIKPDLFQLNLQYLREFRAAVPEVNEVTIIHLSDLHIGSSVASLRLPRLTQLVKNIVGELGANRKVVIAISGDLMDNPDERNFNEVRYFLQSFADLSDEALVTCLGNHDVRKDGYLGEDLRLAMRLPTEGGPIRTFCEDRFGIVSFNSVIKGRLARGFIGEQQMADIATNIDRAKKWADTRFIGMLHHHPVPVAKPKWYSRPFYEKLLGRAFERTDALEDADEFTAFAESRRFGCVLHGHKHIPHIGSTRNGLPIYGCGSSVGKVGTVDRRPYLSLNVVSYNLTSNRLTARLLGERVVGGGLVEQDRTELLSIPKPAPKIQ